MKMKRPLCPSEISDHVFCYPAVSKLAGLVSGPYPAAVQEVESTGGNAKVSSKRGLKYVYPQSDIFLPQSWL